MPGLGAIPPSRTLQRRVQRSVPHRVTHRAMGPSEPRATRMTDVRRGWKSGKTPVLEKRVRECGFHAHKGPLAAEAGF